MPPSPEHLQRCFGHVHVGGDLRTSSGQKKKNFISLLAWEPLEIFLEELVKVVCLEKYFS